LIVDTQKHIIICYYGTVKSLGFSYRLSFFRARALCKGCLIPLEEKMLKSCKYCGRVHDEKILCPQKESAQERRASYKNHHRGKEAPYDRFRHTNLWKKTRDYVFHRDRCLCLCCLAELEGTEIKYNTHSLSVHHITPLKEDYELRADPTNALTVCPTHHEMCESGTIGRELQRQLVQWSEKGFIDMKERLEERKRSDGISG